MDFAKKILLQVFTDFRKTKIGKNNGFSVGYKTVKTGDTFERGDLNLIIRQYYRLSNLCHVYLAGKSSKCVNFAVYLAGKMSKMRKFCLFFAK